MKCCSECFSSIYLKQIINSNEVSGSCDFCGTTSIFVYDPKELSLIFQNVLDLYVESDDEGNPIEQQIEIDFPGKIFSEKVANSRRSLLEEIVRDDYSSFESIFNHNVINEIKSPKFSEVSKPFLTTWEKLAEEIKYTNRFHLQNFLDLEKLSDLLKHYLRPIAKGKKYYRARISSVDGFPTDQMGNPPKEKAKAGRANPAGISYLYLSDKEITTLYETRAALYDYVTIGEFRLRESIQVVNLRGNTYDPILLAEREALREFLIYQPFMSKLEEQLSKPKRRSDNELDYLPTQYLSEFIKSAGFEGVEFQSSLYESGYNLAVFSPNLFDCINTEVCEVKKIDIMHERV